MAAPYIRVRDNTTGHEFDVPETSILLKRGAVTHVKPKLYPPARYPRPTKYHLNLAARPGVQESPDLRGGDDTSPDTTEE